MTKYNLTKEQKENLYKYIELLDSNDIESEKLGVQLFYDDFGKAYWVRKGKFEYERAILLDNELFDPCINTVYWINKIENLLECGFYLL